MFELLLLPFFVRALIVGIILGILMPLLGVFVTLRKMSFFADAIGHAALTGIALGILSGISPFWAAFIYVMFIAFLLSYTRSVSKIAIDTLLGVFFSASVALGIILMSLSSGYQTDLMSFLFGNILTVSTTDIITSAILAAVILTTLLFIGKKLTFIALDASLAKAEGIATTRYELLFMILLAGVIALAVKFVGVILVTALLITPAASAQNMARSLSGMFVWGVILSLLAVIGGMVGSAILGLPSGPSIILASTIIFIVSLIGKVASAKK